MYFFTHKLFIFLIWHHVLLLTTKKMQQAEVLIGTNFTKNTKTGQLYQTQQSNSCYDNQVFTIKYFEISCI